VINVNGEDVVLQVKTARIFLEITLEFTIKEVEEICKKHIPYGFDINQDRSNYIRKQRTVTDRIKYGDSDLPDELVGMTDQYSKFDDHVNVLKKDD
jgi:Methyl coenzyme M reductase, subunit D